MVEVLGVLSIMGILSLVGLKMYNSAVNSHRANELIYEANKRATMVAAQIMAGRSADQLSIAEFTDPAGYHFGVGANPANDKQFNITIEVVDSDVCEKVKNLVGDSTAIRIVSDDCTELTYNNDLSKTVYPSDYDTNATGCNGHGYTWCAKGNDGIDAKCLEGSSTNCCTNVTYDSDCQSCDPATGTVTNLGTTNNPQSCDYKNDPTKPSTCYAGHCLDPDITTSTKCLTNADCGGTGSGYYCNYTTYQVTNDCEKNGPAAMGCAGETNPENCTKAGTCTKIGVVVKANIKGLGEVMVGPLGYWWSAKNWCEAQGKHLIDVAKFQCFRSGTTTQYIENCGYTEACCAIGKFCSRWGQQFACTDMWDGNTLTDLKVGNGELCRVKYSPIILELAKKFKGTRDAFWTASNYHTSDSCIAYDINVALGLVHTYNHYRNLYALCQ